MRQVSALLVASLLLVVAAAILAPEADAAPVAPPSWPAKYTMALVLELPYAHIREPIEVTLDRDSGREAIRYYDGMDTTLYRNDLNSTFEIFPRKDVESCYIGVFHHSPPPLTSLLPDLTGYSLASDPVDIDGVRCNAWQFIVTHGAKQNNYTMYVAAEDNTRPVRFHIKYGYNVIGGSHYDEYVFNYLYFRPQEVREDMLIVPHICQSSSATRGDVDGPMHRHDRMGTFFRSIMPSPQHMSDAVDSSDASTLHFNEFVQEFGKSYASVDEYTQRRANFERNMRLINEHNSRSDVTHKLRANKWADWHPEEFRATMLLKRGSRPETSNAHATFKHTGAPVPPEFDWRTKNVVLPVRDQGVCGSCWAFSGTGSIASMWAIKTGILANLSPQQAMDCMWDYPNNQACNGGNEWDVFQYAIDNGGIGAMLEYPYLMADGFCHPTFPVAKVTKYFNTTAGDENDLMNAVATHGPVSVAIMVADSFIYYGSGVYYEPTCKSDPASLDHAVLVVGYGSDGPGQDYWIVQNSWSTHWGDEGYVKMARNRQNNCGIATTPNFPVYEP